jgi:hypothetical protein
MTTAQLGGGWETTALLVLVAVLMHEPWRWLGLKLGSNIDVEGEVFQWVRAVATALVAGLVMRLVLFPAGALGGVPMSVRLIAFAGGIAGFYLIRRSLAAGMAVGVAILVLGKLLL